MNFQDSLKTSAKTKDDVANEEQNRKRQQDLSAVDKCVKQIEQELLNKAKHGEYEAIDGENIVECKFHDYDCARFLDQSTISYTPSGVAPMEISIQINERFDFFINTLTERLAREGIIIVKHYLAYIMPGNVIRPERKCPAVINKIRDGKMLSHEKIVIECRTTIPKEYSEEFIFAEQAKVEEERKAEEARKAEVARRAEEKRRAAEAQKAEDARRAEEARKAEEERKAAEARRVEEARKAEEERIAEEERKAEILRKTLQHAGDFDNMEGHQFEAFCAELLSKNGFTNVEKTQGSGDQGVDIIAFKDGVKFGIQCKCYSSDVGNKAVQEVFTGKAYYHCHVAAILTNSHFTQYAKELAQMNNVVLWDRNKLIEFIGNAAE